MKDVNWMEKNLKTKTVTYTDIRYMVVNFIDDSNSMIGISNPNDAKHYINRYFNILIHYYTQNKHLINPEKANLLVIANPAIRNMNNDMRIITETKDVHPKKQINILGFEANFRTAWTVT